MTQYEFTDTSGGETVPLAYTGVRAFLSEDYRDASPDD